jgi:ribonuclease HI
VTSAPAYLLHVDGASRGNPGEAAWGVHVARPGGETVAELCGCLGTATNNVAEYEALVHGLRWALEHGAREVEVLSDSELMVRQMAGRYRVKNPGLLPLFREAAGLMARFERSSIRHVRREENREADALANRALDERARRRSDQAPERRRE